MFPKSELKAEADEFPAPCILIIEDDPWKYPRSGPIEFATFDRYICILDSTGPDPDKFFFSFLRSRAT
jgi:hypothetical protein